MYDPTTKGMFLMFKLTPPVLTSWPGYDNLACGTDRDEEDGFTLIEILVVIIIIGILAAVAIPIFLNQQRVARDSQTTQDTRNAATALETGMIYDTTATTYRAFADENGTDEYPDGVVPEDVREFWVQVGNGPLTQSVKTEGTYLKVGNDDIDGDGAVDAGAFRIDAWNDNGREYLSDSTLVYRNGLGGIQSEKGSGGSGGSGGGDTTPGDDDENPGEEAESGVVWVSRPIAGENWSSNSGSGDHLFSEGNSATRDYGIAVERDGWDTLDARNGGTVSWELLLDGDVVDSGTSNIEGDNMWNQRFTVSIDSAPAVPAADTSTLTMRITGVTAPGVGVIDDGEQGYSFFAEGIGVNSLWSFYSF